MSQSLTSSGVQGAFFALGLLSADLTFARQGFLQTREGQTYQGDIHLARGGFVVTASNAAGQIDSIQVPLDALARLRFDALAARSTPAERGLGNGLLGYYFPNSNLTGNVVTRLDQTLDFDWGTAEPLRGMPRDSFSVVWMGEVLAPTAGPYTFCVATDGGSRLFVKDQLLCEGRPRRGIAETSGIVNLQVGERTRLRFEYFHSFGAAHARLLWNGPATPRSVIPRERLFAASFLKEHTAGIAGERGLLGTFYKNSDFTGPTRTRIVPMIDFNGDEGALAPDFSPNSCSVLWRGQVQAPVSEVFTFSLASDETARLWLDQQLLINRSEAELGETSERVPLKAGERYDIEVAACNTGGGLLARLLWSSPSVAKAVVPPTCLIPSRPTLTRSRALEATIRVPPGVLLRNGSFLAGLVEQAGETSVRVTGRFKNAPISTVNVARIYCQEVSQHLLERVSPGRSGVLLARGDFIEGEFRGLQGGRVQISSVLFGRRRYEARQEVLAVFLRETNPAPTPFELQLRDRSVLRATRIELQEDALIAEDPLLGRVRLSGEELAAVERTVASSGPVGGKTP